ncbi:MAG: response regulator [Bdellovibrionaceae bacterium]|nr:response regulator [Pseudobdellovibrionaceae bacterium]
MATQSEFPNSAQRFGNKILKMDPTQSYAFFMEAPVAICVLEGPDHIFRLANPYYVDLFCTQETDLIGKPIFEALPEILAQGFKPFLDEAYLNGKPFDGKEFPMEIYRPDGLIKKLFVDFVCQPYKNNDGKIVGLVSIITDVTEKVVAIAKYRRAKEEAERANELKSAFLANMSHEIRTPLSAMIGFADLLREENLTSEERKSCVDVLIKNGQQLSFIINDILDLSKVEAGHLRLEYLTTKPKQIAEDIVSLFQVKAREKNLNLTFIPDKSTPEEVSSDPVRVRQVLTNLVSNAIKFTENGSVTIQSMTIKHSSGRDLIAFEVTDTGMGIPLGAEEKLFEMFVQGDTSTTRRFGGTGLGLALSRKLANALGGNVIVKSSIPNLGSTFLFTFDDCPERREVPGEVAEKKKDFTISALTDGGLLLKNVKVLVVDDAPDNQLLIWHFLTKAGAQLESAENGLDGFEKAINGNYDLVLMDVQMPLMDGYTATQKLRDHGYKKPIIALTAHAMSEVRKKCLAVGYTDHLTKPINPKELISCIAGHAYH